MLDLSRLARISTILFRKILFKRIESREKKMKWNEIRCDVYLLPEFQFIEFIVVLTWWWRKKKHNHFCTFWIVNEIYLYVQWHCIHMYVNIYQYAKGSDGKPHAFTVSFILYTFFFLLLCMCTVCVCVISKCFHILNFFTVTDIIKFVVAVVVLYFFAFLQSSHIKFASRILPSRAPMFYRTQFFWRVTFVYAHSIK